MPMRPILAALAKLSAAPAAAFEAAPARLAGFRAVPGAAPAEVEAILSAARVGLPLLLVAVAALYVVLDSRLGRP